jgi:glutamate synthase domain-containing protein 3
VIAGASGGTGASPLSSIKHAGLPWELGLAEAQQVLVHNNLRRHVRLQVDGGVRCGRDVLVAALLGAEEYGLATAALISAGCMMLRRCHENSCSVGIATQNPQLRERFAGRPEHIERFFRFVARELRELLAGLGLRSLDEAIGRVDLLRPRPGRTGKSARLDLSALLHGSLQTNTLAEPEARRCTASWGWSLDDHPDTPLLDELSAALDGQPLRIQRPIGNRQRAAGARLSGAIARRHGARGLADDTVHLTHEGSAGQSYGAFAAKGLTLELCGEANDYVGKGLSGGRVVVYPPAGSRFSSEENVIIGNTALYGATSGEAFIAGQAGERFAVRNSGAKVVVEGLGDHGCEYMTGGVVVVLGPTGRNFAAGMSGGEAYVFDRQRSFAGSCNTESVELEALFEESDLWLVYGLIEDHVRFTASALGKRILDTWEQVVPHFVKVMPRDYKAALQRRRALRPPHARRLSVVEGGAA